AARSSGTSAWEPNVKGCADPAVACSSASVLVSRFLNVVFVTVTAGPPAQKLFFARFCSLFASRAPSSGFGVPSIAQVASNDRCTLMVSKGRVQVGVNWYGACALPTALEETADARHANAVRLRIHRIA